MRKRDEPIDPSAFEAMRIERDMAQARGDRLEADNDRLRADLRALCKAAIDAHGENHRQSIGTDLAFVEAPASLAAYFLAERLRLRLNRPEGVPYAKD